MPMYHVKITLTIEEEVEANSEEAARVAFAELWSSAEEMCESAETTVEEL